jgi:hypothetical protein
MVQLSSEIEKVLHDNDRHEIEAWLQLLQAWLRETFLAQQGIGADDSDDDTRKRFLERFPDARLDRAIDAVERAIADTRRNVYLAAVLNSLAHELRMHIASPRSV